MEAVRRDPRKSKWLAASKDRWSTCFYYANPSPKALTLTDTRHMGSLGVKLTMTAGISSHNACSLTCSYPVEEYQSDPIVGSTLCMDFLSLILH